MDPSRSHGFIRCLRKGEFRGITPQLNKKIGNHSFESSLLRLKQDDKYRFSGFLFFRPAFDDTRLVVETPIASGGFGTVSRGNYLGETVAVKKLFGDDYDKDKLLHLCDEIVKEASIIEQKKSKFIVQLYHFSRDKGYIVMEYCKHGSLYDLMRRENLKPIVLDWKRRLEWMTNVALGMNVLHNQPPTVLHRDLKSPNIFIDEHLIAKVGDFGLSKPLRVGRGLKGMISIQDLNMIWQAPEVRKDKKFSTKSDVYSFGVIMHEMLLLKGPYGSNLSEDYAKIRINNYIERGGDLEVPEDRSLLPGEWHPCLESYIDLIHLCCAPNPADRPEFGEISKRLKDIKKKYVNVSNVEDSSPRFCSSKHVARHLVFIIVFILLLALIFSILKHWLPEEDKDDPTLHALSTIVCFGFLLLLVLVLYLKWDSIETQIKNICKQCSRSKPNSSLDGWESRQLPGTETNQLSEPSAFVMGPAENATSSTDSQSSVNLPVPTPEQWKQIREGFICELKGDTRDSHKALFQFCCNHPNEQLASSQWETFMQILGQNSRHKKTETWKRYQDWLSIPMFPFRRVVNTPHRTLAGEPGPSIRSTTTPSSFLSSSTGEYPPSSTDSGAVSGSLPVLPTLEGNTSFGVPAYESIDKTLPLDTLHEVSTYLERSDQEPIVLPSPPREC